MMLIFLWLFYCPCMAEQADAQLLGEWHQTVDRAGAPTGFIIFRHYRLMQIVL